MVLSLVGWIRRHKLSVVIGVGSVAVVFASRAELLDMPSLGAVHAEEVLLVPPGEVLRQLDLGYHSLAADLLFVRANLYYGHHMYTDERLDHLAHFIDILLKVDPEFREAYLWGAMVTIYNKRQIDFVPAELIARANRILAAGMQRFPRDFRFPMRMAFNLYYELGEVAQAIPYFVKAANLPGAPGWLRKKAVDLYAKQGDRQLARSLLTSVLADMADEELTEAMIGRLDLLLDPTERERLTRLRDALRTEWRSEYGYLPYDLFLLIREP